MPSRCSVCALPPVVRRECEDRLQRRGLSLRAVAAYATELGHACHRDALARHLTHLGPNSRPDTDVPVTGGSAALVALAAQDVLAGWPSLAAKLAQRLYDDGLVQEARIVTLDLGDLQGAIEATRGTEAEIVLSVRVLCAALHVIMPGHPEVCHEVAAELNGLGAPPSLADTFEWLAAKPLTTPESVRGQSASGTAALEPSSKEASA